MRGTRQLVLLGLMVVAVASFLRAASVERERHQLITNYEEAKQSLQQSEAERQHLNTELAGARQTIEGQAGDLQNVQGSLNEVQEQLDRTLNEMASLKKQHEETRQQNASLTLRMDQLKVEKQQLEAKLSSLKELKLAIRELKSKEHQQRWVAWRKRIDEHKKADQEKLASGNQGYVIRKGVSTVGTATRMHVHVLDPQAQ